jgi:site-specific recombinase XerC
MRSSLDDDKRRDRAVHCAQKRVALKKGWMAPGQAWLFPGYRGQHMSARQLHRLVRLAATRAGITKRVGVHTLRHSFATLDWLPYVAEARLAEEVPDDWARLLEIAHA